MIWEPNIPGDPNIVEMLRHIHSDIGQAAIVCIIFIAAFVMMFSSKCKFKEKP